MKQDSTLNLALMRGERKELTTFNVNTNEMRCECQIRNSTELKTQKGKNSRTSSNEDKVEIQDIMSECEVGEVNTNPEMEHGSH